MLPLDPRYHCGNIQASTGEAEMLNKRRICHIAPGTVAVVLREYQASEKFTRLARSTQRGYRIYLAQAERRDTLGALDVNELACRHVQGMINGFVGRAGAQGQAL